MRLIEIERIAERHKGLAIAQAILDTKKKIEEMSPVSVSLDDFKKEYLKWRAEAKDIGLQRPRWPAPLITMLEVLLENGFTYEKISHVTGLSPSAISSFLSNHRARARDKAATSPRDPKPIPIPSSDAPQKPKTITLTIDGLRVTVDAADLKTVLQSLKS